METLWKGIAYRPGFMGSLRSDSTLLRSNARVPSLVVNLPRASQSNPCRFAWGIRAESNPRRPRSTMGHRYEIRGRTLGGRMINIP